LEKILKLLSQEEYFAYYHRVGKCVDDISKPNKPINERRLQSKYEKYVSKEEKKKIRQKEKTKKVNDEWDDLKQQVLDRDGPECQFLSMVKRELGLQTYGKIVQRAGVKMINQIDLAHIFPRSTHPELKYDSDNVIFVNRYCHSLLDEFKSPITEERITVEDKTNFFLLMLPKDRIERLEQKTGKKLGFE